MQYQENDLAFISTLLLQLLNHRLTQKLKLMGYSKFIYINTLGHFKNVYDIPPHPFAYLLSPSWTFSNLNFKVKILEVIYPRVAFLMRSTI